MKFESDFNNINIVKKGLENCISEDNASIIEAFFLELSLSRDMSYSLGWCMTHFNAFYSDIAWLILLVSACSFVAWLILCFLAFTCKWFGGPSSDSYKKISTFPLDGNQSINFVI